MDRAVEVVIKGNDEYDNDVSEEKGSQADADSSDSWKLAWVQGQGVGWTLIGTPGPVRGVNPRGQLGEARVSPCPWRPPKQRGSERDPGEIWLQNVGAI